MLAESHESSKITINRTLETQIRSKREVENIRVSLIVDIDGDGDAFGAGFEPSERGLLVGDDERSLGGGDRGRRQQQSGENEDRSSEFRIRHW